MSKSIYTRLAFTNLKNNRKTYVPYILTAILTVMMFYIIQALAKNNSIGDGSLSSVLSMSISVVTVFAVIFLFYTNSFLIKRRKKEIGLYNILGMGKRHIARMLFVETVTVSAVSIGGGLVCGLVFSKFMWLLLMKILHYEIRMDFEISGISIVYTLIIFGIIFAMTLIYNLIQIRLSNPIELLRGGSQGEREPKTKWILAVFGIVSIGAGYYMALTTEAPLDAIGAFFTAVVFVILGTYALFVAGSVALLKLLKKNKKFYYQSKHFTSVSGMIYRMKQNAVGLANICILSTMVLVMISSTVSLYMGMEDILKTRFPRDVQITNYHPDQENEEKIQEIIEEVTKEKGVHVKEMLSFYYGGMAAVRKGNKFVFADDSAIQADGVCELNLISQEDYNQMEGAGVSLAEDEALFYNPDEDAEETAEEIQINKDTYRVVKQLDSLKIQEKNKAQIVDEYFIIVSERSQIDKYLTERYEFLKKENPDSRLEARDISVNQITEFDLNGNKEKNNEAAEEIQRRVKEEVPDVYCESRELNREGFYFTYGGLFFIGLYLGAMFLMATVLIIYYKQISEGYDDKERYQIMQKVGMSKREIKRSIRSQVLIVFFLPLVTALIHIAVAFKVITKLLRVLSLTNVPLFLECTIVTAAVFAVFYGIVFAVTAKEYYKIVN